MNWNLTVPNIDALVALAKLERLGAELVGPGFSVADVFSNSQT